MGILASATIECIDIFAVTGVSSREADRHTSVVAYDVQNVGGDNGFCAIRGGICMVVASCRVRRTIFGMLRFLWRCVRLN